MAANLAVAYKTYGALMIFEALHTGSPIPILQNDVQYLFQLIMNSDIKRKWLSLRLLLLKQARRLRPQYRGYHFSARHSIKVE